MYRLINQKTHFMQKLKKSMNPKRYILNWRKGSAPYTIRELFMVRLPIQARIVVADIRCATSLHPRKLIQKEIKAGNSGWHADETLQEIFAKTYNPEFRK